MSNDAGLNVEWLEMQDDGFVGHAGPILQRTIDGQPAFAFRAELKHRNLRNSVQGGMLMTFADRAMGQTVRALLGAQPIATVQFDMHFVEAARLGDFVVARPSVVRATASIVFVETTLDVESRVIATAKGIWKRLHPGKRNAAS